MGKFGALLEARMKKGDFRFPADWKPKLYLKNLSIYMGSRKEDFVSFSSKEGNLYALVEQYPDRRREQDRLQGKNKAVVAEEGDNEGTESK